MADLMVVRLLPAPSEGQERGETQQISTSQQSRTSEGPEVKSRSNRTKDRTLEKLRCGTVRKK